MSRYRPIGQGALKPNGRIEPSPPAPDAADEPPAMSAIGNVVSVAKPVAPPSPAPAPKPPPPPNRPPPPPNSVFAPDRRPPMPCAVWLKPRLPALNPAIDAALPCPMYDR